VVRVSQVSGREGERFHSPDTQRQRIQALAAERGWAVGEVHEELNVSGGKALAQRPGLRAAVEAVEAGRARVVVAAYLER